MPVGRKLAQASCGRFLASRFIGKRTDLLSFYGVRKGGYFMKKNNVIFGSLKILVCAAILCGMSIVFGKYLAINITQSFRLSFENLPVLVAGVFFGPFVGAAVGGVADIVGCLMVGYTINPVITLGAVCVGLISGLVVKIFKDRLNLVSLLLAVFLSHAAGSVIVKTIGIWWFYSSPFIYTLLMRSLIYLVTGMLEFVIIFMMCKNKAFVRQIKALSPRKPKEDKTV